MRTHLSSWIAMSCLSFATMAQSAHAGPWMDAILNRQRPAYPVGPVPVTANYASVVSNYGAYAAQPPSATGLTSIPFGVPQTVAGYLPTATYDTAWNATPVTYYRPVTSFDPRTGTTVTSLQPCTSVQYQAQRVPLASPRPLLGEVGLQANRWPGITGPGYYPAGLGYAAAYPGYQQIPSSGAPVASASLGTSGVAMGMPASSLPATTYQSPSVQPVTALMPAPVVSNVPTVPYPSTSSYPISTYPAATAYPIGTTYTNSYPPAIVNSSGYGTSVLPPVSSVQPATATMPAYTSPAVSSYYAPSMNNASPCANGLCPAPSSGSASVPTGSSGLQPSFGNVPSIPGAASVTPYGAPTYSSPVPTNTVPPTSTPGAILPGAPATSYPSAPSNLSNPYLPQTNPPATGLPGSAILPPSGLPSGDPEATRQPSLNNPSSAQRPATDVSPTLNQLSGGMLPKNSSRQPEGWIDQALMNREPVPVPPTLRPTTSTETSRGGIVPLDSPAGIDAKPRWNPNLLDADDPVAANEASGVNLRPRPAASDASTLKFISNEKVSDGFQPTFRPRQN